MATDGEHPHPISSLKPTQLTVGMREVTEKRQRWKEHSMKKRSELLREHLIPVVLGPDKTHYIVDHHHFARALHDEGENEILISIIADLSSVDPRAFWGVMDSQRWVHPYDANGDRQHFSDLPKSVVDLKDDPFRSLAGEVRRAGGFVKDGTLFSEFLWVDFLRCQLSRQSVEADFQKAVERALVLAKTKQAAYLPGWSGKDG